MPARIAGILVVCTLSLTAAGTAAAQTDEPIGRFVVDARGTLARFKGNAEIAGPIGADAESLPTRGLGFDVGAHVYPLRRGGFALGLGAELVAARDSRTAEATTQVPSPPTVTTRFSALAPQVSLNFGKRDGYSYLSGGLGTARLTSDTDTIAGSEGRVGMMHYGGGARWFTGPHVAFTFDVRFYTVNAREPEGAAPGYPKTRMMVISAGVSFR